MIEMADVAIVGGGPAGTATALALTRCGYSVVVVERSEYQNVRVGETLPPAIQLPLTQLGVWERFVSDNHSASFGIYSAWGRDDLYDNNFIFNPYGSGWHIDRRRFDSMLALAAEEAGARVYRNRRLISCVQTTTKTWQIEINCDRQQQTLQVKFLVDATGRSASVARRLGARRIVYDQLVGVVVFLSSNSLKTSLSPHTLIEAVETGWWYSAPLPDSRFVVAYMTDADLYVTESQDSSHYWWEQLHKATHTDSRIHDYLPESTPTFFTANSSRLDRLIGSNWLVVGDAATAFDPLSSQGVYKALQFGVQATQAIDKYWTGNDDALLNYASQVETSFNNYLMLRNKYYSYEKRWLNASFWQRRAYRESQ